ncbi:MAG: ABC transporter ATP-binding protein [Lachnospiraceae bacterium]|nr:ABC transporter ATP-binding protein [Lachnospiraceae bacterium]
MEHAIEISDLTKTYRLYRKPSDRLRDELGFSKKKRYTELHALNHVSFHVDKGETVGIIGTNGSGKSTILKMITGVLTPTSGNIRVNGRISALLELGAGFNMEYTGIENVYLNGTMLGFSKEEIDARLDNILKFADIGDFVNQPVKTYSSGMFVRLAFAVAINIDPEILIVDEALSVGDVFFQAKCYHKFEEFKEQGKTILFVSHDLSSISKYCDRVVLLNKGVMLAEGKPKEMVDLYKKLLVNLGDEETEEEKTDSDEKEEADGSALTGGLPQNPETLEYGEGQARICQVVTFDDTGKKTNVINKGKSFTIRMRVQFMQDVESPIFAYTFKNLQGTEITGTNTLFEKSPVESMKAGQTIEVRFTQDMDLQGGEYLLSFGCTGYHEGEFRVFHRLYDVLNVTVISTKNTVGFYDMNSEVTVRELSQ